MEKISKNNILEHINKTYLLNINDNTYLGHKCRVFYNNYYEMIKSLPDMRVIASSSNNNFFFKLDEWNNNKRFHYIYKELTALFIFNIEEHIVCWNMLNNLPIFNNFKISINEKVIRLFNDDVNMFTAFYRIYNFTHNAEPYLKKYKQHNFLKTIRSFCITYPSISYVLLLNKKLYSITFLGNHHAAHNMIDYMLKYQDDISEYCLISEDNLVYDKININDTRIDDIIYKSIEKKNKTLFIYLYNKHKDNEKYKENFIQGILDFDNYDLFIDFVDVSKRIEYLDICISKLSINIFSNLILPHYCNDDIKKSISFRDHIIMLLDRHLSENNENILSKLELFIKLILENIEVNRFDNNGNDNIMDIISTITYFDIIKIFLDSSFDMYNNINNTILTYSPLLSIIYENTFENIEYFLTKYDVTPFQLIYDMIYIQSKFIQEDIKFYEDSTIHNFIKIMIPHLSSTELFELNWLKNPLVKDYKYDSLISPMLTYKQKEKTI